MKAIMIFVLSMVLFVSAATDWQPARPAPARSMNRVESEQAIAGTWHSFPAGMLIRFNGDGQAAFGLDERGNVVGYSAKTWFDGQKLLISFTDYTADSDACETAVGSYEV